MSAHWMTFDQLGCKGHSSKLVAIFASFIFIELLYVYMFVYEQKYRITVGKIVDFVKYQLYDFYSTHHNFFRTTIESDAW